MYILYICSYLCCDRYSSPVFTYHLNSVQKVNQEQSLFVVFTIFTEIGLPTILENYTSLLTFSVSFSSPMFVIIIASHSWVTDAFILVKLASNSFRESRQSVSSFPLFFGCLLRLPPSYLFAFFSISPTVFLAETLAMSSAKRTIVDPP